MKAEYLLARMREEACEPVSEARSLQIETLHDFIEGLFIFCAFEPKRRS